MTLPLAPADLANAVTSFCTIGAGLVTLLLCALVRPQPLRWWLVYANVFFTGLPTLGWHGWGLEAWRVADVGTNLLLAFFLQLAVLGDFHPPATQRRVALASGLLNLLAIAGLVREAVTGTKSYAIDLGAHGGFYPGEAMLIADSLFVVALFVWNRARIPARAKPLLWAMTLVFTLGFVLATAAGDVVTSRVIAHHALWHVVGGFGFVLLWAFNHVRMEDGALACAVERSTT